MRLFQNILFILFLPLLLTSQTPNYEYEPVVMTNMGSLLGSYIPDQVHAYAHDGSQWVKIPFQIDERVASHWLKPYGDAPGASTIPSCFPSGTDQTKATQLGTIFYCDPTTNIGADINPLIDDLDELVFMYKDAGSFVDQSITLNPTDVINAGLLECVQVEIKNPITSALNYVYLFAVSGTISQSTEDYVNYTFNNTIINCDVDDSETSLVTSPIGSSSQSYYEYGFSRSWVADFLTIGNTPDLIDRRKFFLHPLTCNRTEETASSAENAFIANIDGDVRAIRSVMGANSGPFTERTQAFYQQKHESFTHYRVHAFNGSGVGIYGGAYDVYDFNSNMVNGDVFYGGSSTGENVDGNGNESFVQSTNNHHKILPPYPKSQMLTYMDFEHTLPQSHYLSKEYYNDSGSGGFFQPLCAGDDDQLYLGTVGFGLEFIQQVCTDPSTTGKCEEPYELMAIRNNYFLNDDVDYQSDLELALQNDLLLTFSSTCQTSVVFGCTDPNSHNYDPLATQDDGSCETCDDNIQNGDEEKVDCGGILCVPCCQNGVQDIGEEGIDCGGDCPESCDTDCTVVTVDFENFNISWGDWSSGGIYADLVNYTPGNRVVRIRGNSSAANISYTLGQDYDYINLTFIYQTFNYTTNFDLQLSQNSGLTWQTVESFSPSNFGIQQVTSANISNVTATDMIRIQGTGSSNNRRLYLDDIEIEGCSSSGNKLTSTSNLLPKNSKIIESVSPNPSTGIFTIRAGAEEVKVLEVYVFAPTGKVVYQNKAFVLSEGNQGNLDLAQLPAGSYIMKVISGDRQNYEKLIIVR